MVELGTLKAFRQDIISTRRTSKDPQASEGALPGIKRCLAWPARRFAARLQGTGSVFAEVLVLRVSAFSVKIGLQLSLVC